MRLYNVNSKERERESLPLKAEMQSGDSGVNVFRGSLQTV